MYKSCHHNSVHDDVLVLWVSVLMLTPNPTILSTKYLSLWHTDSQENGYRFLSGKTGIIVTLYICHNVDLSSLLGHTALFSQQILYLKIGFVPGTELGS